MSQICQLSVRITDHSVCLRPLHEVFDFYGFDFRVFRFSGFRVFGFLGFQDFDFSCFQVFRFLTGQDARFFGRDGTRSSTKRFIKGAQHNQDSKLYRKVL